MPQLYRLPCIFSLCLLLSPLQFIGAMESLSDEELESTTGQAFITIDNYDYKHIETDNQGNIVKEYDELNYTRINLGLDIKIGMNADEIVFGQYDRPGELTGAQTPYNADLYFKNYAMGHVDLDGNFHPFQMIDPYIEFAYDRSNPDKPEFAGFRFGFGESLGMLSIDAKSFTGAIDVVVDGDFTTEILGFEVPLLASFTSSLVYVNPNDPNDPNNGNPDPVRALYIGVQNGSTTNIGLNCSETPVLCFFLGRDFTTDVDVNTCADSLTGQNLCFPLKTFESILIGTPEGQPANGLFQSVQARPMAWKNDPNNNAAGVVDAGVTGWFFNIPNGSTTMTPDEAAAGRPRVATEYIDRGVGRFHTAGYLLPDTDSGHIPFPTFPNAP